MRLGVGWVCELQLFALFGRLQPHKNLQLSLIPLNFVRPVTPKVAGSSPVAPATFQLVDYADHPRSDLFGSSIAVPGSANQHQCLAVGGSIHAGWPWASVTSAHADSIISTPSFGIGTYCNSSANLAPVLYDQSKNLSISIAVSRRCCCL